MMRVQVVPPDGAITCAIWPSPYSGLVQVHPGLRRVLHQLLVVGDRPAGRDVRPQLRRDQRLGQIVGGVRRRVVGEQVLERLHQPAVGVQHQVGRELAGGGFGLHARDQLAARRADHLDADEGKLLAEFVDDLLLHLDEGRRVEDDLAFLARRLDQAVGGLERRRGRARPMIAKRAERRCRRAAPAVGSVRTGSCAPLPSYPPHARTGSLPQAGQRQGPVTAGSRRSCSTRRSSSSRSLTYCSKFGDHGLITFGS